MAYSSLATNLASGDANGVEDVFVRDRTAGTTQLVSTSSDGTPGYGTSGLPDTAALGRHVAFQSTSTNLVAGDTNGKRDIFVRDLLSGSTTRASVGSQSNGDGGTFTFGDAKFFGSLPGRGVKTTAIGIALTTT